MIVKRESNKISIVGRMNTTITGRCAGISATFDANSCSQGLHIFRWLGCCRLDARSMSIV